MIDYHVLEAEVRQGCGPQAFNRTTKGYSNPFYV